MTTEGQDAGVLQILGGKPTECGSYFKMSDSESATYQIVGHGSKLNDRLAQEQRFNLIKVTKCYRKGLCLVIEEFESLNKNPGFIIIQEGSDNLKELGSKFVLDLAEAGGGISSDGSLNTNTPFFQQAKTVTPRQLRSRKRR